MNPIDHYRKNKHFYNKIQNQLKRTNQAFRRNDRVNQRRMLLSSHRFAVLSIQTPVDIHESAFWELEGLGEPSGQMKKVNYWKNKTQWINHASAQVEQQDKVIDLLMEDKVDEAHKILIDEFKGLGAKKGAFVLAMLGFTEKMCIDTNVEQIADIDEVYSGVVVEKYEAQCEQVREQFSELAEELNPFMVQWVLFDTQRGERRSHNVFFNAMEKYSP